MTVSHEHVVDHLERDALDHGVPLEGVESYVAARLGVPVDDYVAYLAVWAAIEDYRQAHLDTAPATAGVEIPDGVAGRIGWHAAAIYAAAVRGCCPHLDAAGDHAAAILEDILLLRALPCRPNGDAGVEGGGWR